MKQILFLTVISLTLFSCTRNDENPFDDDMISVSLSLTLEEPVVVHIGEEPIHSGMSPLTRTAELDANNISNLWVLQFDPTTRYLLNKVYLDAEKVTLSGTGFKARVNLKEGIDQEFRFVANTTDALFTGAIVEGTPGNVIYTLSDFNTQKVSQGISSLSQVYPGFIPMVGSLVKTIDPTTAAQSDGIDLEITMSRLYSKVNVAYDIKGSPLGDQLKMKEVRLVNSPCEIPLKRELVQAHALSNTTGKAVLVPRIETTTTQSTTGNVTFYLAEYLGGQFVVEGEIKQYAYSGRKDAKNIRDELISNAAHLELVATYTTTTTTPPKDVVFRIYLGGNDSNNYNILSNTIYNISTKILDVDFTHHNVYLDPP